MAERKDDPEEKRDTRSQYMPVTDTPSQQGTGGREIGSPGGIADEVLPDPDTDGRITTEPNADPATAGIRDRIKPDR